MAAISSISKDTLVPVSLGLLILLTSSIWLLTSAIKDFKYEMTTRLSRLEAKVGTSWTYGMEKDSWHWVKRNNPEFRIPNVSEIRDDNE